MKELIKKFIPKIVLNGYHYSLAILAKIFYNNPSQKMIIIGVTGTAGKSSTSYFITQILNTNGIKTGLTSTTLFNDGQREWLNDKKMTMLGRMQTQKMLRNMLRNKCAVAVIETSSQGIEQYRHIGINYDFLVFTNLYPEHIEAHGSFENYKQAKGKLFKALKNNKTKTLKPFGKIKKTIIINNDDKYANYFLNFSADKKIIYGLKQGDMTWRDFKLNLLGEYNKYNVLASIAVARELNINEDNIKNSITKLKPLPGRLEFITNKLDINIIVDYAFEPQAVTKLYETINNIKHNKIIHVLGSTGGGRDKARRVKLGKLASEKADIIIVTNEDPYDEEPMDIINEVASGALNKKINKKENTKYQILDTKYLYTILDRREAIKKALTLAQAGDLVLITGKGAEQAMVIKNNKHISWDDRMVVREELHKLK